MTPAQFLDLTPAEKAEWLDEVSPTGSWALRDDVFCLHCDAVFKAEDVACDDEGDPTCPVCRTSTPLDFHRLPWWREDLIDETDDGRKWKGQTITAMPGNPRQISPTQ